MNQHDQMREALRREFPLLDEIGLDQELHHCEWSIQQERKRLHQLLDELQNAPLVRLTDEEIEALRHKTFSTNNPFCPCDAKTMRKAANAVMDAMQEKNK